MPNGNAAYAMLGKMRSRKCRNYAFGIFGPPAGRCGACAGVLATSPGPRPANTLSVSTLETEVLLT